MLVRRLSHFLSSGGCSWTSGSSGAGQSWVHNCDRNAHPRQRGPSGAHTATTISHLELEQLIVKVEGVLQQLACSCSPRLLFNKWSTVVTCSPNLLQIFRGKNSENFNIHNISTIVVFRCWQVWTKTPPLPTHYVLCVIIHNVGHHRCMATHEHASLPS